jgi:uncharacterized oligopeptide transporter (OPT) family protein
LSFGRKLLKATILENNIIQTTGSASESIVSGVAFTLPGFLFLSTVIFGAISSRIIGIIGSGNNPIGHYNSIYWCNYFITCYWHHHKNIG